MNQFDAVDPGVSYYALARFLDGHLLVLALNAIEIRVSAVDMVVLEKPVVYGVTKAKARNKDIVDLAIGAGRISDRYAHTTWYTPAQWKGQVPKPAHQRRILTKMTEGERAALSGFTKQKQGHLIDAIGLGLYYLGRM